MATKWTPICKKPCRLAVPLRTEKLRTFSKNRPFLGSAGIIFAVYAPLAIFVAGILFGGFGRTRMAKSSLSWRKPILLSGRCCMAHTAVFTATGAIFSDAVRGVSRVICG